jgi:hypothetical protein
LLRLKDQDGNSLYIDPSSVVGIVPVFEAPKPMLGLNGRPMQVANAKPLRLENACMLILSFGQQIPVSGEPEEIYEKISLMEQAKQETAV